MKGILALTISIIALLGIAAATVNADTVSPNVSEWAKDTVNEAEINGMIPLNFGLEDYTQAITREKFCELAYNTIKKITETLYLTDERNPFLDTDNYTVLQLYALGIINGKSEDSFAPDDTITREEAATILYRIMNFVKMPMPDSVNEQAIYDDDNAISDWAKTAVYTVSNIDIMQGVGNNIFSPQDHITVEQTIAIMLRLKEKAPGIND